MHHHQHHRIVQVETGLFAIWHPTAAIQFIRTGLYAQHRGHVTAGVVVGHTYGGAAGLSECKGRGSVSEVLNESSTQLLRGQLAMGQVRFSRDHNPETKNIQPVTIHHSRLGPLSALFNGHMANGQLLRGELDDSGAIFQTTSQAEILLHLMARFSDNDTLDGAFRFALDRIAGAFVAMVMSPNQLLAARDPHGFLPLCIGECRLLGGELSTLLASETCAFDTIEQKHGVKIHNRTELEAGDMVKLGEGTVFQSNFARRRSRHSCSNLQVFLAGDNSTVFQRPVALSREKIGEALGRASTTQADVVIAMSGSTVQIATAFASVAGIQFRKGLRRNDADMPLTSEPVAGDEKVRYRFSVIEHDVRYKRVVLVIHHLFTGRSCKEVVKLLFKHGAREVHVKVGSPPTISTCYYGQDVPPEEHLLAQRGNIGPVCEHLEATSIQYLSLADLRQSLGEEADQYCYSCFTGNHPQLVPEIE